MLYLSRLRLQPRHRDVQKDLSNCHALHSRILSAFPLLPTPSSPRAEMGVLYRLEEAGRFPTVIVQSRLEPDWSRLPEGYLASPAECKRVDDKYSRINQGDRFIFRLRANPTRRIARGNTEQAERWRGKRVELQREEDQIDWLIRKGDQHGFKLLSITVRQQAVPNLRVLPNNKTHGWRQDAGGNRKLTFGSVQFEGVLEVTNRESFMQALEQGIGSGKAFGFGLLSIAPAPGAQPPDEGDAP